MLFHSVEFALFFTLFFFLYWGVFHKSITGQNLLVLSGSYVFYAWWDVRFLALIVGSSLLDYFLGRQLGRTTLPSKRKVLLALSLLANLGLLSFFKYYNFFIESFMLAAQSVGLPFKLHTLQIILPVGISFYTFQTLSYTIDIYRRKLQPSKNIIAFMAFVAFFPQLVAGPIERAAHLLPQFERRRRFNYLQAVDGLRQALWGLFKKVVVADNCAVIVDDIFLHSDTAPAPVLLLGALLFTFQIYGDFSGYSDMAIGIARILNFRLSRNFAYPFFSENLTVFWQRWHISLSSWFRDYVYIPLGGNRKSRWQGYFNVLLVFLLSGLWHGARFTFIVWGGLHGLALILQRLAPKSLALGKMLGRLWTFTLVCLSLVFFRANSLGQAKTYLGGIFWNDFSEYPSVSLLWPLLFVASMLLLEWRKRSVRHPLLFHPTTPQWQRWLLYYSLALTIYFFKGDSQSFIYFQF